MQQLRGLFPTAEVTAANGRENRDKSATMSPWFRAAQAILLLKETPAR